MHANERYEKYQQQHQRRESLSSHKSHFIPSNNMKLLFTFTITTLLLLVSSRHAHCSANSNINSNFIDIDGVKNHRPTDVVELTSDNYDQLTKNFIVVVLNFYADWCPYSARWKPIFQKTGQSIYNQTLDKDPYTIIFGKVNCVVETTLAQRFRVTKFPTTKLTIDGKTLKKEYRGARNYEAFSKYITKILTDPIEYVNNYTSLSDKIDDKKAALILFSGKSEELRSKKAAQSRELENFRRVARQLRDDCNFFYILNHIGAESLVSAESYHLAFKDHHKPLGSENYYNHDITDAQSFASWAKDQCIPLVREITFENAEELSEEGLPFVILFYSPNDKSTIELFKKVVEAELKSETTSVTFVYADGNVFSHPLMHLGKTRKDLPLIAIDNFRHLFAFKKPVSAISQPGVLKNFLTDLHSGKLDREFHFGPDPIQNDKQEPVESAFQKLAPSASRYSFPRDEL